MYQIISSHLAKFSVYVRFLKLRRLNKKIHWRCFSDNRYNVNGSGWCDYCHSSC